MQSGDEEQAGTALAVTCGVTRASLSEVWSSHLTTGDNVNSWAG